MKLDSEQARKKSMHQDKIERENNNATSGEVDMVKCQSTIETVDTERGKRRQVGEGGDKCQM